MQGLPISESFYTPYGRISKPEEKLDKNKILEYLNIILFDSPKMHLNIIFQQGRRYNYCALLKKKAKGTLWRLWVRVIKDYFKIVVFIIVTIYILFYIFS